MTMELVNNIFWTVLLAFGLSAVLIEVTPHDAPVWVDTILGVIFLAGATLGIITLLIKIWV